jgi:DNA-directed RNA polymerase specialized sigma24 family protein
MRADAWRTQPESWEDSRLAPSKIQKEVEKLPLLLRRYEPPRIRIDARDAYVLRRTRERALACFDPEDRRALDGERVVLYFVMLGDVPSRCREVFRLYFIERKTFRAIAARLGIKVRTAQVDWIRALKAIEREQREVEREGVVAKRT